ncbi:dihydrodipicolinate synthase family protein [Niabella ginsenosidivorans]|uniref:Dihydrodipicolinate synthase family protein n=1 Tax=Niabella ginsenosidivorans TaxID=1176587 RepID=A0A1A9HZR3_9BACT|nr:dihydrodipicolinate synthase family protein [Niabella ginsenosidivorans]ANH80309.1 dihydrodipicolinate synthase family protein [Niabella ginsenosidivorans]
MKAIAGKFVPVMITPFDLKARIDYDAVTELLAFYLEAGVEGFFANCLSSEMFSITEEERLELTRHVVQCVNGRVPVVATGSFGLTVEDKALFTKKIYDTGADAVIMISGHFAKVEEDDAILLRNFEKLFALTGTIPLGIYECPAPYKRILSADIFKQLVQSSRLIYHKDTSITHENVKAKLEVLKTVSSSLEFYDAHTPNALFSLQQGAAGMSSISGNFYPEVLVWMVKNANNPGQQETVKWLQEELTDVDPMIHHAYPMSAKYFLGKRGLPVRTISRAYALQLTPDQKKELDLLYSRFLGWCQRLGIQPVKL